MARSKDRRKWVRRVIMKKYKDRELADRAKGWSEEKLLWELGITVPKSEPKIVSLPRPGTPERKRMERESKQALERFRYMVRHGVLPEVARKFMRESWRKVRDKVKLKGTADANWRYWNSKGNRYPTWIEKEAKRINEEAGFPEDNRYGWAVMHGYYVQGFPINVMKDRYKPDPYDGNRYKDLWKKQSDIPGVEV